MNFVNTTSYKGIRFERKQTLDLNKIQKTLVNFVYFKSTQFTDVAMILKLIELHKTPSLVGIETGL